MRISDWSSDVCSSDLGAHRLAAVRGHAEAGGGHADLAAADRVDNPLPAVRAAAGDAAVGLAVRLGQRPAPVPLVRTGGHAEAVGAERRSEEHTSELQSLMRISYAVFCLKKKNKQNKSMYIANLTPQTEHKR